MSKPITDIETMTETTENQDGTASVEMGADDLLSHFGIHDKNFLNGDNSLRVLAFPSLAFGENLDSATLEFRVVFSTRDAEPVFQRNINLTALLSISGLLNSYAKDALEAVANKGNMKIFGGLTNEFLSARMQEGVQDLQRINELIKRIYTGPVIDSSKNNE